MKQIVTIDTCNCSWLYLAAILKHLWKYLLQASSKLASVHDFVWAVLVPQVAYP